MQDPKLSPEYFKTLTEKTEINTSRKLKLLEQQFGAVKSIILSDSQDKYENKQPFEFHIETSEFKETKPNGTLNLYPNVIEKQTDLKSSNTKETHNWSYPDVIENQRVNP